MLTSIVWLSLTVCSYTIESPIVYNSGNMSLVKSTIFPDVYEVAKEIMYPYQKIHYLFFVSIKEIPIHLFFLTEMQIAFAGH